MKKYLCILILALCASLLPVSPALADTVSWVRITQDNTRFYRNPTNMDADIMFELEKSYYLKVVSEQSYFYQVELMDNDNGFVKIYGYVKKTDVTPCDTVPELPLYPAVYISVTGSNAILYSACSTAGYGYLFICRPPLNIFSFTARNKAKAKVTGRRPQNRFGCLQFNFIKQTMTTVRHIFLFGS